MLVGDCSYRKAKPAGAKDSARAFVGALQADQLPATTDVLIASGFGEVASEPDGWQNGAFATAFLKVCRSSSEVSIGELTESVVRRASELLADRQTTTATPTVRFVTHGVSGAIWDLRPRISDGPNEIFVNSVGGTMRLIPAGSFMMGSQLTAQELNEKYPGAAVENYFAEHPQHQVTISRPFYIGAHEVTVEQFRQFIDSTGYRTEVEQDPKGGDGFSLELGPNGRSPNFNWQNPGFRLEDTARWLT